MLKSILFFCIPIFIYTKQSISIMKEAYKQKVDDLMVSVEGRVMLIEKMMKGEKKPDNREALQFIQEIKKGLENVKEIISIS